MTISTASAVLNLAYRNGFLTLKETATHTKVCKDLNQLVPFKYEELYSRNEYTEHHRENFFKLLSELNIKYRDDRIDDIIAQFLESDKCYTTDETYQNIANISELEKLKDYLLL